MACNKFFRQKKFFPHTFNHKYVQNHSQAVLKVSTVNSFEYSTSHRHHSVFSCRQHWYKNSNLHPSLSSLSFSLFLSTNQSNDQYHVVVTNPSQLSTTTADISSSISNSAATTEANSVTGSASDLTSETVTAISSTTDLTDIAVTLGNEVQSVTQFVEPSLASLGLAGWTPVGLIQMFLEYLHISWNMPWWAAIATSTIIARILLMPVLIKTQRQALTMSNCMPQLQFLQAKFGEARKCGNSMEASRYAAEIVQFMKIHNISPLKSAMMPLLQAPVFLSFFLGLRGMAKTPVESMMTGGLSWTTDLTIPDPYYILPLVSCGTLYVVLKIGAESGVKMENLKLARYFVQALPVVALPFCIHFPAAVLYYWVTTNFCTLLIVSVLKIKPVREYLKLPTQQPINPKFAMPKKGFVAGVKEAYEDQKVLASIDDRRRMDEMRFLKAGTGPIPRTYSYDPTKTRPSNAAEIAKQAQSVSAKERGV